MNPDPGLHFDNRNDIHKRHNQRKQYMYAPNELAGSAHGSRSIRQQNFLEEKLNMILSSLNTFTYLMMTKLNGTQTNTIYDTIVIRQENLERIETPSTNPPSFTEPENKQESTIMNSENIGGQVMTVPMSHLAIKMAKSLSHI